MSSSSEEDNSDVSMVSAVADTTQISQFKPFTKAERIHQLNDIDKSITELLRSAGLAIQTLTATSQPTQRSSSRRETFTEATDTYLQALHSVDVRLKRQIKGLSEGGIIRIEGEVGQDKSGAKTGDEKVSQLDVSWLNSRSGKVEKDMEAELWARAREFVEKLQPDWKSNSHEDIKKEDRAIDGNG